jgi:agmatinase
MSQTAAFDYIRSGQIPFFRLPQAESDFEGFRAVLLGVQWDGGTAHQPGARFAPVHVRRVSATMQSYNPLARADVFSKVRAADGGNIPVSPFNPGLMREVTETAIGSVLAAGAVPLVVGGDHSVALPCLRAAARKHGPLAVVHVDAHLDVSGPEQWGDPYHHGTSMRHALEEGLIERGQLFQLGIRASWADANESALVTKHAGHIYTMEDIAVDGVAALMTHIRHEVGKRPVYLTFDVSGVDPAFAPGTGTPIPGGLSSREALELVRGLRGLNLCGADVVEVLPALDHADLTSHLAAHVLYEALGALAAQ